MTEPNEQDIPLYPDYSKPIKQAFGRRYESVYIIFNPFIRYPEEVQKRFTITTQKEYSEQISTLTNDEYEAWEKTLLDPQEEDEYHYGSPVTWKEVAECYSLHYPDQINNLLNFQFATANIQFEDPAAEERFTCEFYKAKLNAWLPAFESFEPLHCPAFRSAFLQSGANVLTIESVSEDEVILTRKELEENPDAIIRISKEVGCRGRMYPSNLEFQFHVDWDCYFTLFYGSEDFVSGIVNEFNLEGFYCDDTTMITWSMFKTEEEYQKYVASRDQPYKHGKKARFLLYALLSIVLLSDILFIIVGAEEYITLGIQAGPEEIAKYPFGAEGPVAGLWHYESPTNYVKSALLLMVLGGYHLLLTLFAFFRSSNRLTISIIVLGLLNWFIPNFDQTIWSILDHLFPTLYPLLIFG